jgi:multidrug resistance efflux pump
MTPDKRPIPIPLARRLQFVQTKIVPLCVLGMTTLVSIMLWKDAISPAMLTGEVKTLKSSVNSPVAAEVTRINSKRLTLVKAGDIIAELRSTDPRQSLDLLQNELNLLRTEASSEDSKRRESMDFERLQLDWLVEKVNLATAIATAKRAAANLEMTQGVTTEPTSVGKYQQEAQLAKEAADAEVTERQNLVNTLGTRIEELRVSIKPATESSAETWRKTIGDFEERVRKISSSQEVIQLRAPIDGMVTEVLRNVGENVVAGEPLLLLTAVQPESITGYLRQPFPLEPAVGQEVEVRTQGRSRQIGKASVTRVGVHFEAILNPALHPSPNPEVGLPIEVSLPSNLKLRPGELVSLVIRASTEPAL